MPGVTEPPGSGALWVAGSPFNSTLALPVLTQQDYYQSKARQGYKHPQTKIHDIYTNKAHIGYLAMILEKYSVISKNCCQKPAKKLDEHGQLTHEMAIFKCKTFNVPLGTFEFPAKSKAVKITMPANTFSLEEVETTKICGKKIRDVHFSGWNFQI